MMTVSFSNYTRQIAFAMERQKKDQWCWAATATSVAHFYDRGSSWTQCTVANAQFGANSCCENPDDCDRPSLLSLALSNTRTLAPPVAAPLTLAELAAELAKGRPVGARIGWTNDGGHFVVISAVDEAAQRVRVEDPVAESSDLDYHDFLTNYQSNGKWTHAYRTAPPPTAPGPDLLNFASAVSAVRQAATRFVRIVTGKPPISMAPLRDDGSRHRVFVVSFEDLLGGSGLAKAEFVGWRQLVAAEGRTIAVSEVTDRNGRVSRRFNAGPFADATMHEMQKLQRSPILDAAMLAPDLETRYVRIPSIQVRALWLKAPQDAQDIVIPLDPAPEKLNAGMRYPRPEFESIAHNLAVTRASFENADQEPDVHGEEPGPSAGPQTDEVPT